MAVPIGLGLLFIVLYKISRQSAIIIASPSTKMRINASGMKSESIMHFINQVQQARSEREMKLSKRA